MERENVAEIVWSARAIEEKQQLSEYYEYYAPSFCLKLMTAIYEALHKMAKHPYSYPLDIRKKKNNGSYRFLVVYSYRISYRIHGRECLIIRIRHVKQDAKMC